MIIFYNKSDKSKEPIGRTPIYKNLGLSEFLKLFNVEKQQ